MYLILELNDNMSNFLSCYYISYVFIVDEIMDSNHVPSMPHIDALPIELIPPLSI